MDKLKPLAPYVVGILVLVILTLVPDAKAVACSGDFLRGWF